MTPLSELTKSSNKIFLDSRGYFKVSLDEQGCPITALADNKTAHIIPITAPFDTKDLKEDNFAAAPLDIIMRNAVEVLNHTKTPLMLLDDQGRLAGVIGEEEIYRGILRQSSP
jgi:glycine betaine/proline transport system ATP-binding protein